MDIEKGRDKTTVGKDKFEPNYLVLFEPKRIVSFCPPLIFLSAGHSVTCFCSFLFGLNAQREKACEIPYCRQSLLMAGALFLQDMEKERPFFSLQLQVQVCLLIYGHLYLESIRSHI